MWWPRLEAQIAEILKDDEENPEGEARRSDRELLEEVLGLTRRLSSDRERRLELDHPAWDDLFEGLFNLLRVIRARGLDDETLKAVRRLMGPIEYLMRRDMRGPRRSSRPFR